MDSWLIFQHSRGDQSNVRIHVVTGAVRSAQALEADGSEESSEKSVVGNARSVPKLTQVGVANSLRRSREWS
jgi:hypothetical protein